MLVAVHPVPPAVAPRPRKLVALPAVLAGNSLLAPVLPLPHAVVLVQLFELPVLRRQTLQPVLPVRRPGSAIFGTGYSFTGVSRQIIGVFPNETAIYDHLRAVGYVMDQDELDAEIGKRGGSLLSNWKHK